MNEHLLRFNKDKVYTFIDCETENLCLNSFHNLPWQIGMIKVKGEEEEYFLNLLVVVRDFAMESYPTYDYE